MWNVNLKDIPYMAQITASDPDADIKSNELYTLIVAEHEKVAIDVKHDVLVRMRDKKDQWRRHLVSEVKRFWHAVSLIDFAAGFLSRNVWSGQRHSLAQRMAEPQTVSGCSLRNSMCDM